jgi:transposase
MGYSTDLREKVFAFIHEGHSIKTACHVFSLSRSSIQRWRTKLSETGTLIRKSRIRSPYKVDEKDLKAYISAHPDASLNAIAAHCNMTGSGISKLLSRLNITRKKNNARH